MQILELVLAHILGQYITAHYRHMTYLDRQIYQGVLELFPDLTNTAVKRLPVTRANFPRKIVKEKNSRNNKIYEKKSCKCQKTVKGKALTQKKNLRLSETQSSLNNGYTISFRALPKKLYVFKTPGHAADFPHLFD